jgi:biotin carboxyl carrier protein
MRLDFVVRRGSEPEGIRLEGAGETWRFYRNGRPETVSVVRLPDGRVSVLLGDGRQICGRAAAAGAGEVDVVTKSGRVRVRLADPLTDRLSIGVASAREAAEEEVRSPMPGRVLEVRVAEGDRFRAGDVLVVLEAMKMQNEIRATHDGVVAHRRAQPGEAVEANAVLLVLGPDTAP